LITIKELDILKEEKDQQNGLITDDEEAGTSNFTLHLNGVNSQTNSKKKVLKITFE